MENSELTPFDSMTQTREIQMLKTAIPYMRNDGNKKQIALFIKFLEFQNTANVFAQEDKVLSMCSVDEAENNSLSMLNALRKYCTPKELETVDMLINVFSMMETYETMFS